MPKPDMNTKAKVAYCLACHSRIRFTERVEVYDYVTCPECDEGFEVISVSPIVLDWPTEFGDDDDDWQDID
jgi:predicted RNA-binding Zn-ribbon protein involved in translation (DUF1610 family)